MLRRRLPGSYTRHDLGFADFHLVGARLRHGTEVDRYVMELRGKERRKVPSKNALLAFDPSGPAFRGKARSIQNAKLFEKYKWYLSDALYIPAENGRLNGRMVLIKADGPDEAYDLAVKEAASTRSPDLGDFVGVEQLSLVTDSFKYACILCTDEYTVSPTELRNLIELNLGCQCFAGTDGRNRPSRKDNDLSAVEPVPVDHAERAVSWEFLFRRNARS